LQAELRDPVVISYYPSEKRESKLAIHWENFSLPMHKGQKVGELWVVTDDGEVLNKNPLFAKETVEKSFWHKCLDFVKKPFIKAV
jgi:D-alanyl-D-alanine carboxypeptidase (penicillin-binding protein 5/6)